MGYAIAESARSMGAEVILVSGPVSLSPPDGVTMVTVETTEQMHAAVKMHFARANLLIMAAAPADYRVAQPASGKLKKTEEMLALELSPTVDILRDLANYKREGQIVVGFALETENGVDNASRKLKEKNLDLIVLNSPNDHQAAFDFDTNRVTIIEPGKKPETWPLMTKNAVAEKLLNRLAVNL
jgi:phosphopantothenoylcysteine decarboxylase/phosphopantothenate--cysteine ligase